ncbi:MAG: hypothetical protein ABSC55_21020 [Syntrophorhabdales bacterium]
MEKFCIFCGQRPVSKTAEHVIPQWLIEQTGNPNRNVNIGLNRKTYNLRSYAFDQFVFPACSSCNNDFAQLESSVRPFFIHLLNEEPLSAEALSTFLVWLDKVRIGLWLAYLMLNENPFGIVPKFHVARRINASDRMLLIYRSSTTSKGITFAGVNSPLFDHHPSCFLLRVNQFCFVNASDSFLLSRRLGLPFLLKASVAPDSLHLKVKVAAGSKRVLYPLIHKFYSQDCSQIYQPIINPDLRGPNELALLYDTEYTRRYFTLPSPLGKVLIERGGKIIQYSNSVSFDWIPNTVHPSPYFYYLATQQTLILQSLLFNNWPILGVLPDEKRRWLRGKIAKVKLLQKIMIDQVNQDLQAAARP